MVSHVALSPWGREPSRTVRDRRGPIRRADPGGTSRHPEANSTPRPTRGQSRRAGRQPVATEHVWLTARRLSSGVVRESGSCRHRLFTSSDVHHRVSRSLTVTDPLDRRRQPWKSKGKVGFRRQDRNRKTRIPTEERRPESPIATPLARPPEGHFRDPRDAHKESLQVTKPPKRTVPGEPSPSRILSKGPS